MKFKLTERYTLKSWVFDALGGIEVGGQKKMPKWAAKKFARMQKEKTWAQATDAYIYTITSHGGARPGAGRKPGSQNRSRLPEQDRRQRIGVRLPGEMVAWLKNQDMPAGRLIEDALRKYRRYKGYR